jgi:hopanoid biosynthesis associated protein HpnK
MINSPAARRLVVNADDFGRSRAINAAVIRAHREGILTTASLMVNEAAFEEAVALAKENPRLGIGLHLTLLRGHSTLSPEKIEGGVGFRYFFSRKLRALLRDEIAAQFEKFRATGLPLDHVNGHLHLHLHPTVFDILTENAPAWGITHLRLTRDPFWFNTRLAGGHWFYRASHAVIHGVLSRRAQRVLRRMSIKHTGVVFGLLQDARVDEDYVTKLLAVLPAGDSELYSHPSLDQFKHELDALVSPRVKSLVDDMGIRLIRYQDL